jgi:hypothetical protein
VFHVNHLSTISPEYYQGATLIPVVLFIIAVVFAAMQIIMQRRDLNIPEILLSYILLFNVGIGSLLGFYAHTFMSDQTAEQIGWPQGSPFQFEIAMANLAFGVLGVLCFWNRGTFWFATITGFSILFLGCLIGHVIEYTRGDVAPYNIGLFIWFGDLAVPLLLIMLYILYNRLRKTSIE